MLLAHLRAADGVSPQPALVNERSGICTLRALERAARTGHIQRLFLHAAAGVIRHPLPDGACVVFPQRKCRGQDAPRLALKNRCAVSKLQLAGLKCPLRAGFIQKRCAGKHILYLAAVSARVHIYGAAHTPWDAVGEFQAGQPFVCGRDAHL